MSTADSGDASTPEDDLHASDGGARADDRGSNRRERLRGMARRLFRELEEEEAQAAGGPSSGNASEGRRADRSPGSDARDLLSSVLETGDKAKTEIVRLVAREFRTYLEALDLHKDLHHLLTHYSLEVKASIHLKPLGDAIASDEPGPPGPAAGPSSVAASLAPLPSGEAAPAPDASDEAPPAG